MLRLSVVRTTAVGMFAIALVGCDNQQPLIQAMEKEKDSIVAELSEAREKVDVLIAENKTLQVGVESTKAMVAEVQASAKQAQAAAEVALANAKAQAEEMIERISAEAKAQIAAADAKTKQLLADAEAKRAEVTQELEEAKARIAELEAAAKETNQTEGVEEGQ